MHNCTIHNKRNNVVALIAFFCLIQAEAYTCCAAEKIDKITISVYGLKSIGISQCLAASLQEHLESKLLEYEQYDVMSRNNIDLILREKQFLQAGFCSEEECLIEAGNILGVRKIITGTISMVGSTYNTVLKMINVKTAKLESSVSKKHTGSIDTLLDIIEASLKTLIEESPGAAHTRRLRMQKESAVNAHAERIQILQTELEELRQTTETLRNNWEEEKNNVALLRYLREEQEKKIQELEQIRHAEKLSLHDETNDTIPAPKGFLAANYGAATGEVTQSKKSRKIGVGAAAILAVIAASVLTFQLTGADK